MNELRQHSSRSSLLDKLRDVLRDFRLAARSLWRKPALTIAAVVTLAVGIGANTAVFSVLSALLLKPLPYAQPERLVALWPGHALANREIEFLRTNVRSLEQVASVSPGWLVGLTGVESPEQLTAARVSGNLFTLLGVRPLLGRTFGMDAETPGRDRLAVLSYELWQRKFAGDRDIIGRTITLDRDAFTVIGIMPPHFGIMNTDTELWLPLAMDKEAMSYNGAITLGLARLRAGAAGASANSEFHALAQRMGEQFSEPKGYAVDARVQDLRESIVGSTRTMLLVLLGAVVFLLFIATANVANLLLVRATDRTTELAVRMSIGANRARLVWQMLAESLTLAAFGAAAGLAVAALGVRLLRALLPADTPRLAEVSIDGTVLMVCMALALTAGICFGLVPALVASGTNLQDALRRGRTEAARGSTGARVRATLIATEVALAVVLVTGATLMARTLFALTHVDPGFTHSHVLTLHVQPSQDGQDDARLRVFWRDALQRIAALPGVEATGTVLHLPMSQRNWMGNVEVEGRPTPPGVKPPRTGWESVNGDYFKAMQIPLIRGRVFNSFDNADAPRVLLVNQAFARSIFANEDPIGKRVSAGNGTNGEFATIVGIIGDVRHKALDTPAEPEVYVPFDQRAVVATSLVVRTSGDPAALAAAVTREIWSISSDVPISGVRTMDDMLTESVARPRVILTLLGAFAGAGLLLGAIGIYGVIAYVVRQRRREIGIRVALGARRAGVIRLVIAQGMRHVLIGLVIGIAGALMLARALRSLLFGVTPADPLTLAIVPLVLLATALLASWIPARSAASIEPTEALKG